MRLSGASSIFLLATAACGGATTALHPDADAGSDAGDAIDASPLQQPALVPTYDGGGLTLSCTPSLGGLPLGDAGVATSCTYVNELPCSATSECGCGCSCECGICQCSQSTEPGATQNPTCPSDGGGAAQAWQGVWSGTFDWPTTVYSATCQSGLTSLGSTGSTGGPMTVTVIGDGTQLSFQLTSQQGSGQPLCALPFVASGNTATLLPGSSCVTVAGGNLCTLAGAASLGVQTFLRGTATIDANGTMTLQTSDVFTLPTQQGPECGSVPEGQDQTNVESLSATLTRN